MLTRIILILFVSSLSLLKGYSQDVDSTKQTPNAYRMKAVTLGHISLYTGSLIVLNQAWYKDYPKTGIHSFNDSKEWLQVDKIGHAWSAYNLARLSSSTWEWAGADRKKAAIVGTLSGFSFMTVIEYLDSRSAEWGWSWSDMVANTIGSGLYLGQELLWKEQRIQYKFSFHRVDHKQSDLIQRADDLFGKSLAERMLKDYNGQTYWLSFNLKSFLPDAKIPKWLNVSLGYGAEGLYGGFENRAYDKNGNLIFDRRDIPRTRGFYLSPDIDLTKIKTNKKWVRTALFMLNAIKIPAPAMRINNRGQVKFYAIHF